MKFKFGAIEIITIILAIVCVITLIPYYRAKSQYDDFIKSHPNISGKYGDPDTMTASSLDDKVWNANRAPNIIKFILVFIFLPMVVIHQAYINIKN